MEILGIGTDIVECVRIGTMIEQHGELFLAASTPSLEIRYCQARKQATEHFAGRWAAKEAILKAMGTGWARSMSWTDLEVRNVPGASPSPVGAGPRTSPRSLIGDILISISHCRTYATAYALAIGPGPLKARANGADEGV